MATHKLTVSCILRHAFLDLDLSDLLFSVIHLSFCRQGFIDYVLVANFYFFFYRGRKFECPREEKKETLREGCWNAGSKKSQALDKAEIFLQVQNGQKSQGNKKHKLFMWGGVKGWLVVDSF